MIKFDWLQSIFPSTKYKSIEQVERDFETQAKDSKDNALLIVYDAAGEIHGWLNIYTGFLSMAFIDNWNPYIKSSSDREKISAILIEKAKDYIEELGMERLEVELTEIDTHSDALDLYSRWYKGVGFQWAAEEVGMKSELEKLELEKTPLPNGYTLIPIDAMNNSIMKEPFFDSFSDSLDTLFLSMTPQQQLISFNYWFNRSRPMVEGASYALLLNEKCVGFVIARVEEKVAYIGPIGVVPPHRKKGLGVGLLSNCLYELKRQGINTVKLDVSSSNNPAIRLYEKFGFETVTRQVFYYWEPDE
jgi:ribosomal protein S18 acetylase RimI-like enzyme